MARNCDPKPWELNNLQDELQDAVLNSVKHHKGASSVLQNMNEFTALQRLFRAAFDGHLGINFPVEQLTKLAKATASHVNVNQTQTPRWELRPRSLEMYNSFRAWALMQELKIWNRSHAKDFLHLARDCLGTLKSRSTSAHAVQSKCALTKLVTKHYQSKIPDERIWIMAKKIEDLMYDLATVLEIRATLNVAEDKAKTSCPPPHDFFGQ